MAGTKLYKIFPKFLPTSTAECKVHMHVYMCEALLKTCQRLLKVGRRWAAPPTVELWLGSVAPGARPWDMGRRTSATGPLEAPLDCPRRKTAVRNNPRMAQLGERRWTPRRRAQPLSEERGPESSKVSAYYALVDAHTRTH